MSEPDPQLTPEEHKAQGNELYKAKDFAGAIECYSQAIRLAPDNPTFYSNRSAAWQASNKMASCLEDCVRAVELDPTFLKCLQRGLKVTAACSTLLHSALPPLHQALN